MRRVFVQGMHGLGDNINQRPFVRALAQSNHVWLQTPWPQLYRGTGVFPVAAGSRLRTQAKNEARGFDWSPAPVGAERVRVCYTAETLLRRSIAQEFDRLLPLNGEPYVYELPSFGQHPLIGVSSPIALLRPVTLRAEWAADSRNCLPQYIEEAACILRERGYFVVSVADLLHKVEWVAGNEPPADLRFHAGELEVEQLMSLVEASSVIVAPVGWALPAGVAYRRPTVIILGGRGAHNAPEIITDPRQPLDRLRFMMPDHFCRCTASKHNCNKTISDFARRFSTTMDELEDGNSERFRFEAAAD